MLFNPVRFALSAPTFRSDIDNPYDPTPSIAFRFFIAQMVSTKSAAHIEHALFAICITQDEMLTLKWEF